MKKVLFFLLLFTSLYTNAQTENRSHIKGKIVSNIDNNGLANINISIPYLKIFTVTDTSGIFEFAEIKNGSYALIISDSVSQDSIKIWVDSAVINIGNIVFRQEQDINSIASQIPVVTIEDDGIYDDGVSNQSISGILNTSHDPYLSAAVFNFGAFRYQPRGYNRDQSEIYMNGLQMNDAESGTASFSQWSGLNDMLQHQNTLFGLQASENGFGGLSGSTNINATASEQQKQTRLTYSVTNRIYNNRLMMSHSSGLMANGWAYAVSFSKRWSREGYVPGTFYDGYSFYASISKKLNKASMLHFTAFGVPTKSGKAASATLEAMELSGSHFYNPNWGYQNGEKRNAKINSFFQPVFILNYDYTPNNTIKLGFVASYQMGYNGTSALDWYNAQDPRPDYYKRLPSYYESDLQTANQNIANAYRLKWANESYRQIDWDALYAANNLNYSNVSGMSGRRSVYMVGEDRDDIKKYSFAANLQKVINEHINLATGLTVISQQTESYRKMLDLLGGDYYVNLNQFAEKAYPGNNSFNQNNLNNPDGIIKVGDKYSYDYKARFIKAFAWSQLVYSQKRMDLFITVRLCQESFQREGLYKNGLFADDSYGKSQKQNFFNYQLKSGLTYKLKGRGHLFVNVALMTDPPTFDNTFVSPRTRNAIAGVSKIAPIKSIEGGYMLHAPRLNGRVTGFATDINNSTEIMRFYHEDYNSFVNYVMQNVDVRYIGGELALQAKLSSSFSVTAVATWKQVFYTSNPEINIYRDNDTAKNVPQSTAYLKNTYVDAGPQSAYTIGVTYRSPKLWYVSMNCNYLNRNYINVNPSRRTKDAVELLTPGSEQWHAIVDQEVMAAAFTVDLFTGKSILLSKSMKWLPKNTFLYINIGLNNLLDNQNIPTAGFEQLRFDLKNNNPERFPSKYIYGYGTNYFINLSLKFRGYKRCL
jgi:hypothetical protein